MATVLGLTAINEKKFTRWSENGRALGLEWNTREGTVTIPADKIAKALHRVLDAITKPSVTKTSELSLVGSLRHIATCCPPARSFFQRLQDVATAVGRYGRRRLPATALNDLKWFKLILQQHSRFNRPFCSRVTSQSKHQAPSTPHFTKTKSVMPTLYVGTYTRKESHVDGHACSSDEASGALKLLR
jgi:hypothetical protein